MRTIALVVGMLGLLGPIDVWAAASECEEVSAPVPPVDGKWPVASNCCEAALGDSCSAVAPGLVGGRQNVVLTVLDDHGYCQNGFMAGRCVIDGDTGSALQRCGGTVCSNAPWARMRDDVRLSDAGMRRSGGDV